MKYFSITFILILLFVSCNRDTIPHFGIKVENYKELPISIIYTTFADSSINTEHVKEEIRKICEQRFKKDDIIVNQEKLDYKLSIHIDDLGESYSIGLTFYRTVFYKVKGIAYETNSDTWRRGDFVSKNKFTLDEAINQKLDEFIRLYLMVNKNE